MFLYKYVTAERVSVLRNGLVRFTQPQALNDPFEIKPNIAKIFEQSELEQCFDNQVQ